MGSSEDDYYDEGKVQVYYWTGSAWWNFGDPIYGGFADYLGSSVRISGNGNVIGLGSTTADNAYMGRLDLYSWGGSDWIEMGTSISGENAQENFGKSIDLSDSGTTVLVGVPGKDGINYDYGLVQLYRWNGTEWEQRGDDINGVMYEDELGYSVAISGDGLIICCAAINNDCNSSNSGQVKAFSTPLDLSIEKQSTNAMILVYPNPSTQNFTIQIVDPVVVSLYSSTSEIIISEFSLNETSELDIDVESGIYFLHIKSGKELLIKKLIIN